ncbi:TauD/TfdA family dioxygenase [Calothrix sp. PCC 6303]|uniref:TauD/TfdA family dioxygenase n=1 Tax=Calothrix sp. PCC 6303 TaxID=1170562 RepID=UPI0002A00D2D|nr:TauD/TfdA family dioxygenase [Calothrix sp. PCC 6303]AFZ01582.1 Taurine catabolism dioxygenase TauD/TfdA [Calothrix sp. PCC 6303]
MNNQETQKLSFKSLGINRKSLKLSSAGLIKTSYFPNGQHIPLIVQPAVANVNLIDWVSQNQEIIQEMLIKHKALLFRDFNIISAHQLEQFIQVTSKTKPISYYDRSSPRHEVAEKIYTSTDYPAEQSIFLHSESTYCQIFPKKIYFCCLTVALEGGETPIADCQRILESISLPTRERFIHKKVLYVRNYNDGFGLSWQNVFQTTDKAVVEDYCLNNEIEYEWKQGDRLRTRQVRPAIIQHPITGATVWFNHAAFFHVTTLEPTIRKALLSEFLEADLPHNTYYGDGSSIQPETLAEIRAAYNQETIIFPWHSGDILLLDNILVAHGRKPFQGNRQVIVGMAEPCSYSELK